MKYFGCAYYPEYWGVERVKIDAELMREAGINLVRIGEFAWSRLEPRQGVYVMDWLNEAIEIFAHYDINVVMCTPSAAAPAWLIKAHPETLIIDKHGQQAWFGVRQHTCYVSPVFRSFVVAITEQLAKEMARHPNVIAWQIDNEIGHSIFGNCYCEICQDAFRLWLKERYSSIDALNRAWGAGFWSMDFSNWDEIRLGGMDMVLSASHIQDSLRFFSVSKIDYVMIQANILRNHHPNALVTTNHLGWADRYTGYANLDRVSADIYATRDDFPRIAFYSDCFRSVKKDCPFWVMETGIGDQGFPGVPHNERLRSRFWHFIAHGAEMIVVFRWRSCLSGREKDLMGVLGHSGNPRHRYQCLKQCLHEIKQVSSSLDSLALPQAKAAVVFDHEILWASCNGTMEGWIEYERLVQQAHEKLMCSHIMVDFIPMNRDFSNYKLIWLPSVIYVDASFARQLETFVSKGGVVLITGPTGIYDASAKYLPTPGPEHLNDLLGLSLEDGIVLHSGVDSLETKTSNRSVVEQVSMTGHIGGRVLSGVAHQWIGDVDLQGGTALMTFENGTFKGQPAVVENKTGLGTTLYVAATTLDDTVMEALVHYACSQAGIQHNSRLPMQVEITRRGQLTFLINHSVTPISVPWDQKGSVVVGNRADGLINLGPYDVCVIQQDEFPDD